VFEEKWWKPKSFEQLEAEEKDRQFRQWIIDKCKKIISYRTDNSYDYDRHYEKDGYMIIDAYTKERFESCRFKDSFGIPINDFWDLDNVADMKIEIVR
jgi:hypothetical protein